MNKNNYLNVILTHTGKKKPSQLILYFFDILNLEFLKKKIQEQIFRDFDKKVQIDTNDVFDIMMNVYKEEMLYNEPIDLEKTIKKMNRKTVIKGIQESKSSIIIEKYRKGIQDVHTCMLPVCTRK